MTDRIDGCNEMGMSNLSVPCREPFFSSFFLKPLLTNFLTECSHCGAHFCYACGKPWKTCPCDQFGRGRTAQVEPLGYIGMPFWSTPLDGLHLISVSFALYLELVNNSVETIHYAELDNASFPQDQALLTLLVALPTLGFSMLTSLSTLPGVLILSMRRQPVMAQLRQLRELFIACWGDWRIVAGSRCEQPRLTVPGARETHLFKNLWCWKMQDLQPFHAILDVLVQTLWSNLLPTMQVRRRWSCGGHRKSEVLHRGHVSEPRG